MNQKFKKIISFVALAAIMSTIKPKPEIKCGDKTLEEGVYYYDWE